MTDYGQTLIDLSYIVASILFILGIKMLGKPERARMGNMVSALGMLIAIVAVLFECCLDFTWTERFFDKVMPIVRLDLYSLAHIRPVLFGTLVNDLLDVTVASAMSSKRLLCG